MHLHPVRSLAPVCALLCVLLAPTFAYSQGTSQSSQAVQGRRVLVFSKTSGFRHPSINAGRAMMADLADAHGFTADFSDTSTVFNAANLAQYDAVIWLNTSGNVLYGGQQTAFENYIQAGGGYVGIHSATDTEYEWPWYGGLIGGDAYFQNHPAIQEASLDVVDPNENSTAHFPLRFDFTDEWYNFQNDPTPFVDVLLTIDETTYTGGSMGPDHPISWQHDYNGGRSWYTVLGHRSQTFEDPDFQEHLLGGIAFAVPEPSFAWMLMTGCVALSLFGTLVRRARPGAFIRR